MDDLDRAQALEESERDAALARATRPRADEAPFESEGVRVCLDCYEPIARKRLTAQPTAVRCVACQGVIERAMA